MTTSQQNILFAGAFQCDITPPLGIDMAGYFNVRKADKILDNLYAKSVAFKQDDVQFALVACDLCMLPREAMERIRQTASRMCGIPEANVMIVSTHTHTGPTTMDVLPGEVDGAYLDVLVQKAASAVAMAVKNSAPAIVRAALGEEGSLAFNRRYFMKDGTVRTNPGKNNADVIGPTGPIDPDLLVAEVSNAAGEPVSVIVNHSNHLDTIGGCGISADFPTFMSRVVQRRYGDVPVLFIPAASGNVNHINFLDPNPQGGYQEAQRIGETLGTSVLRVLEKARTIEPQLSCRSKFIEIKIRKPTSEQVKWAEEVVSNPPVIVGDVTAFDLAKGSSMVDYFYAGGMLFIAREHGEYESLELQALSLGDVVFLGIPGEPFVEVGQAIKHGSRFKLTGVASLANGASGYIPTQIAFSQGGYEPRLARSSKLEESADDKIAKAAIDLLDELWQNQESLQPA